MYSFQAVAPVLDNPAEPVSDLSYFDCLDLVMEKSQVVGEAGAKITSTAKKQNYDEFGEAVDTTAKAVCQLTMSAAQAAYLVGIADPSSIAATPGLVDQTQFARASQAISMACQNLLSPNSTQQQVSGPGMKDRKRDRLHLFALVHVCVDISISVADCGFAMLWCCFHSP